MPAASNIGEDMEKKIRTLEDEIAVPDQAEIRPRSHDSAGSKATPDVIVVVSYICSQCFQNMNEAEINTGYMVCPRCQLVQRFVHPSKAELPACTDSEGTERPSELHENDGLARKA